MKYQDRFHFLQILALAALTLGSGSSFAELQSDEYAKRVERLETQLLSLEERIKVLEGTAAKIPPGSQSMKGSVDWKNRENWRALRKGMTKDEVRSLLGEPDYATASGSFETWYWTKRYGPNVTFHEESVYGWEEPDWK